MLSQFNFSEYFEMYKTYCFLVILQSFLCVFTTAAECPSFTKVQTCTPRCWQDSECSAIGGKCCPNICNERSCAQPNVLSNSGFKSSPIGSKSSGGPGTYCGNVKCTVYEKCVTDPITKRLRCMRT